MVAIKKKREGDKLKKRYLKIFTLFLLIAIIYLFWTIFHIVSVYFLGFGNKWAILTMDQWIISSIILYSVFIALVILFALHHYIGSKKSIKKDKPKPTTIKGKRLHIYTQPKGSKGGIFSKTFIKIDEDNIVSLQYQMVPPGFLWGKKE